MGVVMVISCVRVNSHEKVEKQYTLANGTHVTHLHYPSLQISVLYMDLKFH